MTCASCGASYREGDRFCSSCGSALEHRDDQRRIVTVLFGDLVGFTTLSETLDPELVKNLVDQAFERLAADIVRFGGRVDKVLGDGLLALFGAPVMHEDDAERAVRAALEMQQSMGRLREAGGVDIHMRIGVNTGEVLVGEIHADGDYTAMGDVVNTANRLQATAEPDTVLVGPATYEGTSAVIRYEQHGPVVARGRDERVATWRAIEAVGLTGERDRAESPLIGRDLEVDVMNRTIDAAVKRRRANLVLVFGDAGVGKTRLVEEVTEQAQVRHGARVISGRCLPYGEANAWFPIADAMRNFLGIGEELTADETEALVRSMADRSPDPIDTESLDRVIAGLQHLLGIGGPLADIDPVRSAEEAAWAVRTVFKFVAHQRPLILRVTDLHWADEVVLTSIDTLMRRMGRHPFVVLATARHSLADQWRPKAGRANVTTLSLEPLDRDASANLLDALLPFEISTEQRELLLDRAGGNPFFLEELVALVSSDGSETADALPSNLRGLIGARLDGLTGPQRQVLEDAAVLGRRGTVNALERMVDKTRGLDNIGKPLDALQQFDLLEIHDRQWQFRSDLVHDVVYGRITKHDRAIRHHGVGTYLVSNFGDRADPATVAYHFRRANEIGAELGPMSDLPGDLDAQAIDYTVRAARAAIRGGAAERAIGFYSDAIELLPEGDSVARAEILTGRARALSDGHRHIEARADVTEALRIGEGDPLVVANATLRLAQIEQWSGEFDLATTLYREAIHTFDELDDAEGTADARQGLGLTYLMAGRHDEAEEVIVDSLDRAIENNDDGAEAWAYQNLAWLSYVAGRTAEADERLSRARRQFKRLHDQLGVAWSDGLLAYVRLHQGRFDEAEELAGRSLHESRQRGDPWGEAMMDVLFASIRLWTGRTDDAIDLAEEARSIFRSFDDPAGFSQAVAIHGRALLRAGRTSEGIHALKELADDPAAVSSGLAQVDAAIALAEVTIGDPDAALMHLGEFDPAATSVTEVGQSERLSAYGMARLQRGEVDEAVAVLLPAAEPDADGKRNANAAVSAAMAAAANGDADSVRSIAKGLKSSHLTYIDEYTLLMAQGLVAARSGDAGRAREMFARGRERVSQTSDVLAEALITLAEATALEALGDESALAVTELAEQQLDAIGIEAMGWRTAFRLAAGLA
ncbi:MAG: adenylate/guanylate cyclase domain-containing protein [Acidimicrobiales bacterium]